jgi:membrane-associated protein
MDSVFNFVHNLLTEEGIRNLIVSGGYVALFIVIFSETGLLIGFFLPGDSLLVTAGLLTATHMVDLNIVYLNLLLMVAAIAGDAVGYFIGNKAGHTLYSRPNSKLFKREHLMRTHAFYEKHGGKTIIFARFVPIVRTFAPVVAGAADMGYKKFAAFNIFGGILWVGATTMLGYSLASAFPNIGHYLQYVIAVVIFLSILPPIIEWWRTRSKNSASARKDAPRAATPE